MKKTLSISILFVASILIGNQVSAQVTLYKNDEKQQQIDLLAMAQFWGVYEEMDEDRLEDGDARTDMFIRRGRLGVKGSFSKNVEFRVWYAYDLLGKDLATNTFNGMIGTNTDDKNFQVWDAFVKFKIDPKFNITTGFFRPQTSRESFRSAFGVMTFEKTYPNFVHRAYTVNKGPGRSTGINFNGTFGSSKLGLSYDLGAFNTFEDRAVSSLMYAGRLALHIGAPEKGFKQDSHFGKKNGIIVGVYGTTQSKVCQQAVKAVKITNLELISDPQNALQSISWGTDFLGNYNNFNLKAEYAFNQYSDLMGTDNITGDYAIRSYDIIGGYNLGKVFGPGELEFAVGYSAIDSDGKLQLGEVSIIDKKYGNVYGDVSMVDLGFNYYLKQNKYKLNLHYVIVTETAIDVNNNYLGAGMQYIF